MDKLEAQINQLVDFIAEGHAKGDRATSIAAKLTKLEGEAESERRALAALSRANAPIKLPTVDEMLSLVFDLEARLNADVARGREELRPLFRDGRIDLVPQPGGFYVARSALLPMSLEARGLALLHAPARRRALSRRLSGSVCRRAGIEPTTPIESRICLFSNLPCTKLKRGLSFVYG